MLAWTIYISFIGAVAAWLAGRERPGVARLIALASSLASFAVAIFGTLAINPSEVTEIVHTAWIPSLGISYFLAADGISCTLVILTGLAAVAGVLFSWNISHRANEFSKLSGRDTLVDGPDHIGGVDRPLDFAGR